MGLASKLGLGAVEVITSAGKKVAKAGKNLITPAGDLATTTGTQVSRSAISGGRTGIAFKQAPQGVGKVAAPKMVQQAAAGIRTTGSALGLVGLGGLSLAGGSLYLYDRYKDVTARTDADRRRADTRASDEADMKLYEDMVDSGYMADAGSIPSDMSGSPVYSSREEPAVQAQGSSVWPLVAIAAAGVGAYYFLKKRKVSHAKIK